MKPFEQLLLAHSVDVSSHAAFRSGFMTAVPFMVISRTLKHNNLKLLFKALKLYNLKSLN